MCIGYATILKEHCQKGLCDFELTLMTENLNPFLCMVATVNAIGD